METTHSDVEAYYPKVLDFIQGHDHLCISTIQRAVTHGFKLTCAIVDRLISEGHLRVNPNGGYDVIQSIAISPQNLQPNADGTDLCREPKETITEAIAESALSIGEEACKTLTTCEHIRLRTEMYIDCMGDGSHDEGGIYELLTAILEHAIQRAHKSVEIYVNDLTGEVSIRDDGCGLAFKNVVDSVTQIDCGGMGLSKDDFNKRKERRAMGGTIVNALSERFCIRSYRKGFFFEALFAKGKLIKTRKCKSKACDGTSIRFLLDASIFPQFAFREAHILCYLRQYAILNHNLTFKLNGKVYGS